MYDYVRRMYRVNPVVGHYVQHSFTRRVGRITSEDASCGHYVQVLFTGDSWALPCHPTEMAYLGPVPPD
jgi:hypothetical protein